MPFKKILVAVDGSEYSQIAADYAFWLAAGLDSQLCGQHVVDPRLVDLFVAPEFAEELGFGESIQTAEKVLRALKKVGRVVLDLFSKEAFGRQIKVETFLDVGYIVEEIVKRAEKHDLLIIGHRGRGQQRIPRELMIGSVAERVAVEAKIPVLIAESPVRSMEEIVVAFDGSEPARGALLMAERLAKLARCRLTAVTVVPSKERLAEGKLTVEQGEGVLREYWPEEVFLIREGHPAKTLLDYAAERKGLLVVGAYGFRDREDNVLGSTTTHAIRRSGSSVLVYR